MSKLGRTLGLRLDVMQAPMTGVCGAEFVAKVSESGCLGSYGVGLISAEKLQQDLQQIKRLTNRPFNCNVFIPNNKTTEREKVAQIDRWLEPIRQTLDIQQTEERILESPNQLLNQQMQVICQEKPAVVSFCFGLLDKSVVAECQQFALVFGTATTVEEARMLQDAGVDAIVAQGSESGGHRGTFAPSSSFDSAMIGSMALIPQVADAVSIPVIAAGGISDARQIQAARILGADMVSMGTAFLTTVESGASEDHKRRICSSELLSSGSCVTKAFTGKMARVIPNSYVEKMIEHEDELADFVTQRSIIADILSKKNEEYMPLYMGQSGRLAKNEPVSDFINRLENDLKRIKRLNFDQ